MRVEVFSLGFGPKIFQFKRKDTVYCLSLVPLGGYVKLFGDNPRQDIPKNLQKMSFLHQSFWPKSAIALAGPMMNLILAVLLFMVIGFIGKPEIKPYVGDLKQDNMAFQIGFRSGDQILSVNKENIKYWSDVQKWVHKNPDKTTELFLFKGVHPNNPLKLLLLRKRIQN